MADTPKKGIFRDPWRTATPKPKVSAVVPLASKEFDTDEKPTACSISLPNYGGLTVGGVSTGQDLGRHLLEFCIQQQKIIEPYLLQYGIILVKLSSTAKLNTKFYIQRSDGWTLAVPEANTREQGLLQLVQAFLELDKNPATHTLLENAAIRPFRQ